MTDAHLHLGRLSPAGLAGGEILLDPALAERAIAEKLGAHIDKPVDGLAIGLLDVLEANMAGAIRRAAAKHGDDLREFALVAGGGAGPLHAANLIVLLGMPAAIVPARPGLLSAIGLLRADLRHDLVRPVHRDERSITEAEIEDAFIELERTGGDALGRDGVVDEDRRYERSLDIRYFGQEYSLAVPIGSSEPLSAAIDRFHVRHEQTFGHASSEVMTEVVAVRVLATGSRALEQPQAVLPEVEGREKARLDVLFNSEQGRIETAIHDRDALAAGQAVEGPAIIEQLDTTTVLPPGFRAEVHETGSLIIRRREDHGGE